METVEQQKQQMSSLSRVAAYPLVSSFWNSATQYYNSAKESDYQLLRQTVGVAESVINPALETLRQVPESYPQVVEQVDGLAVRQLDFAEGLVGQGNDFVQKSREQAVSLLDQSGKYVQSTSEIVTERATGLQKQAFEIHEQTVAPYVRPVDNYVRSFFFFRKSSSKGEEEEKREEEKQKEGSLHPPTPFERFSAVFPSVVRFDGDVIARPLVSSVEFVRGVRDGAKQRKDMVFAMLYQAKVDGENKIGDFKKDFSGVQTTTTERLSGLRERVTQNISGLKETSVEMTSSVLSQQRMLLKSLRDVVVNEKEKSESEKPRALLRFVPGFVFVFVVASVDFSDELVRWTNDHLAKLEKTSEKKELSNQIKEVDSTLGEEEESL